MSGSITTLASPQAPVTPTKQPILDAVPAEVIPTSRHHLPDQTLKKDQHGHKQMPAHHVGQMSLQPDRRDSKKGKPDIGNAKVLDGLNDVGVKSSKVNVNGNASVKAADSMLAEPSWEDSEMVTDEQTRKIRAVRQFQLSADKRVAMMGE